jgi:hypothetical protein
MGWKERKKNETKDVVLKSECCDRVLTSVRVKEKRRAKSSSYKERFRTRMTISHRSPGDAEQESMIKKSIRKPHGY